MDFSPGMLQKARALVTSDHVRFARHDITAPWPAASGSADIIIALLVLEHIQDLAPIFDEVSRVLRPGGELLLAEFHPARQMLGKPARYIHPRTGELLHVTAYPHDVADYVNGGVRAGLTLYRQRRRRQRARGSTIDTSMASSSPFSFRARARAGLAHTTSNARGLPPEPSARVLRLNRVPSFRPTCRRRADASQSARASRTLHEQSDEREPNWCVRGDTGVVQCVHCAICATSASSFA